jgi:hypothetical protein
VLLEFSSLLQLTIIDKAANNEILSFFILIVFSFAKSN